MWRHIEEVNYSSDDDGVSGPARVSTNGDQTEDATWVVTFVMKSMDENLVVTVKLVLTIMTWVIDVGPETGTYEGLRTPMTFSAVVRIV
ncbi:hypothetical protein OsJ_20676 [Oryza sativa Japonica Group]|uniref:Uncharacterized protein n=1 Tax=Oryza sativa subsp. japonica TaxID=39947 RepID=A3B9W1_ORYSJ|nr:hypothetical protein OsJ_20676 [Oryza sativa Japonica Group]